MSYESMKDEINKLKTELQELEDRFIKVTRMYEDMLNNLDADNFSGTYRAEQDNKFTKIKVEAEGIKTEVANLDAKTSSAIEQTADAIRSEVKQTYQTKSGASGQYNALSEEISEISQAATGITSIVKKIFAPPVSINRVPTANDDISQIYKYKGKIYYYDDAEGAWKNDNDGVLSSMFQQDAKGFTLNGNVKIDGNTYQNGAIYVTGKAQESQDDSTESALYICDGSSNNVKGFISFNANGKGNDDEAKERMLIASKAGNALKILTFCGGTVHDRKVKNISIGAGMWDNGDVDTYSGSGYVYIASPIVFSHFASVSNEYDVTFQAGCEVDFTNAKVSGLYAVFA